MSPGASRQIGRAEVERDREEPHTVSKMRTRCDSVCRTDSTGGAPIRMSRDPTGRTVRPSRAARSAERRQLPVGRGRGARCCWVARSRSDWLIRRFGSAKRAEDAGVALDHGFVRQEAAIDDGAGADPAAAPSHRARHERALVDGRRGADGGGAHDRGSGADGHVGADRGRGRPGERRRPREPTCARGLLLASRGVREGAGRRSQALHHPMVDREVGARVQHSGAGPVGGVGDDPLARLVAG